ncbi:hydroxymethylglutaryl-CoA synthase [Gordonia sp. NPDC003424]
MTNAILGYATYVPGWRVDPRGRGNADRIVASYDEDAVTMAVAAAGAVLDRSESMASRVRELAFVTSSPPYLDKTNATTVHAALGLDRVAAAYDTIGTGRSTVAGIRRALSGGETLITAADVRTGRPGSADERSGSDAAAAVLIGDPRGSSPAIAEVLAYASVTEEFLDRWRPATAPYGQTWEERFGFERYAPLIREAVATALDDAGVTEADHVVLTCPNTAVTKRAATLVKGTTSTQGSPIGFAGAADPLLGLAAILDTAAPDETIVLISAVDGADAIVLRTTDALVEGRQAAPIASTVGAGRTVSYPTYLSWRGLLDVEPPRRPEPDVPAASPSSRAAGWKFGLNGSRCTACGFTHLPPMRVCRSCGAVDDMTVVPLAGSHGRIATYTVDRLAYSPSPPVVDVVVDFAGGGRTTFEVADAREDLLAVGVEVDLVFRCLFTAGGVRNYFWKARQRVDITIEDKS